MYQVLYRKWRPRTFDEVSGQEHITETLKSEIASNRINHAYLFTGSRGTGKTSCAKILSKAVNCINPQNGNPCGECEICKGIDNGSVLDVVEMDAASNRNIDDIRDIIDEVQFKPAKCKYRVYIIDEVHMLTTQAFNALLKTLEEPPEHVIFILATTEIHKLPQTILSRCQRFDFHRISPKALSDRLLYVAQQEEIKLPESSAMLIASVADGAMRDALSLLDRCSAISTSINDDIVRNASGLARKDYLFELSACVINKNTAKALEMIDSLYSQSKDMSKLCDELLMHFRSLMLIKSVKNPRDILIMSDDEFEQSQTQADYLSLADIVYYMNVLSIAFQRMGSGADDRTEFEMAIVKLSSAELDGTLEALTARVTALEKAVKRGIAATAQPQTDAGHSKNADYQQRDDSQSNPTNRTDSENPVSVDTAPRQEQTTPVSPESVEPLEEPIKKSAPVPVVPPSAEHIPERSAKSVDVNEIYRNAVPFNEWVNVVDNMKSISRAISAAFAGSTAYVSDNYLLIDTNNEMAFELLKSGKRREEVRKIILETTGRVYKLGPYKRIQNQDKKEDPIDILKNKLENTGIEIIEE